MKLIEKIFFIFIALYLLGVLIFIGICIAKEYEKISIRDNIENEFEYSTIYKIVEGINEKKLSKKEQVSLILSKALKLENRRWYKRTQKWYVKVLLAGWKEFNIHPINVLTIARIESTMKTKAYNRNSNGTKDYGLCQINSINIKALSKRSIKILKKYKLWHTKNKKYDIAINTMNCFVYLQGTRIALKNKKNKSFERWIMSYNTGIRGSVSKKRGFVLARNKYWHNFKKKKEELKI